MKCLEMNKRFVKSILYSTSVGRILFYLATLVYFNLHLKIPKISSASSINFIIYGILTVIFKFI